MASSIVQPVALALAFVLCCAQARARPEEPALEHVLLAFEAADGTPLEAKLTLPAEREGPVPVVFYLHGAGVRSYDNPFGYQGEDGERKIAFYLDLHERELARRGIALCRMSKRGCRALAEAPWLKVEREVFSRATPEVLLDDYAVGLGTLRARPEVDPERVVLLGSSEGTWMAPRLARKAPRGIAGLVLVGYAADGMRGTVEWQNTVGPWRNVQHLLPQARDGELTRAEYDQALAEEPAIAQSLPFDVFDQDGDGTIVPDEMERVVRPRLDAILKAIEERDDEFLWTHLLALSSAYLLEWWEAGPNHEQLLALDVPVAIFHGDLDGSCRVEGVLEAEAAFRAAGKANLEVRILPGHDHDLNWTREEAVTGCPPAYREVFDRAARLVTAERER